MKRSGFKEWLKIIEAALVLVVAPTVILYAVSRKLPLSLDIGYHFVVSLMVIQAGLSYWYTNSVFSRKSFVPRPTNQGKPLGRATFIVSAYLPNELKIIEATILNILEKVTRPPDGIEVILAYNTPHMEEFELKLRELALKWPEFILANAYNSRSKSENLNYAIELASGEMTVLLDADHLVADDCLGRAWRWFNEGYDVVQGRCKVRNGAESLLSRLVEVEFEVIYGIQHPSKSIIFDTTLFGGTNGYWKSEVLKQVKFREDMLTEDIDSTIRATLNGHRFVHDRSIVSTELAPTTIAGLWFQRKRWSQGWFQCSFKYQAEIWKTKYLNVPQKFIWTTLLSWRVFYDVTTNLLFPILFAFWLHLGKVELPINAYIAFALIFTLVSGPYQVVAAYKNAAMPRAPVWQYLFYALLVWPYTIFKSVVHMVAIRDELAGERAWVVSRRKE